MKRLVFAALIMCLAAPLAHAESFTMRGTIIDNMCASGHKADLDLFIKSHPKGCSVMVNSTASGYSIYSNGKLTKFTDTSTEKISAFLRMKDSKLAVIAQVSRNGDMLDLISIKNAK